MWQNIEGSETRRIAVIGDAAENELDLAVSTAGCLAVQLHVEFVGLQCSTEEFRPCIESLGMAGFLGAAINNPHKADAAKLALEYFRMRGSLGVANALKLGPPIVAQNTEVPAFDAQIADIPSGTALVMGSGRAARSALQSLCERGWKVRLWNRNVIRSKPLIAFFEYYGRVEPVSRPDPTGCSLIVNATPVGAKAGEQPPVLWEFAKPRTRCLDFVYRRVQTEFLRKASSLGFGIVDGRELLVERSALALEWWLGTEIPRDPMRLAVGLKRLP